MVFFLLKINRPSKRIVKPEFDDWKKIDFYFQLDDFI